MIIINFEFNDVVIDVDIVNDIIKDTNVKKIILINKDDLESKINIESIKEKYPNIKQKYRFEK